MVAKTYPMQNLCLAVIVMMPILSAIFCGLRFYARRRTAGGFGADDYLLVIAVLFSFIIIYPSWRLTIMWRYGVHVWDAQLAWREPDLTEVYRMQMVYYMFGIWILPLVKASIIILLLKVGGIISPIKKTVYGLFVFNAIGATVPAFFYLFQCPIYTGQNSAPRTFGNLHCADRVMIGSIDIFRVCFNMFTDVLIFPIPVYLAWKLQKASFRDRVVVIFLFSLSLGVTAIGAARIYLTYKERLYRQIVVDWTWSIAFCVNHLENGMAIIFACIPSLRSLILGWLGYREGQTQAGSYVRSRSYGRPLADGDTQASMALPRSPMRAETKGGIEVTCLTTFDVESTIIRDYAYHMRDRSRSGDASSYEESSKVEIEAESPPPKY